MIAADVNWTRMLGAWTADLHTADQVNLDHLAADAEYLPPSPVANRMRAEVAAERTLRAVTR